MVTQKCDKCGKECYIDAFYNGQCFRCYIKELELEIKPLRVFAQYMDNCVKRTSNDGWILANTCAELIKLKVDKVLGR